MGDSIAVVRTRNLAEFWGTDRRILPIHWCPVAFEIGKVESSSPMELPLEKFTHHLRLRLHRSRQSTAWHHDNQAEADIMHGTHPMSHADYRYCHDVTDDICIAAAAAAAAVVLYVALQGEREA